MLVCDQSTVFL